MTRPSDDEVTSDVDPEWIARIREQAANGADSDPSGGLDVAPEVGDDWLEGEPPWDPEATVGASDGLIERIRGELRGTPSSIQRSVVSAPQPSAPPTPSISAPPPLAPIMQDTVGATDDTSTSTLSPTGPPTDPPTFSPTLSPTDPPTFSPTDPPTLSTTVRWEPRQRLATSAHVQDTPPLSIGPSSPGLDRTKVAIASIIAIALVLTVWLLVRGTGDGESPVPPGSVPGSIVPGSVVPDSVANAAASTIPTSGTGG